MEFYGHQNECGRFQAAPGAKLNIFYMNFNYVSLRKDYLRAWLRRLPSLGFNAVLWELEDKVQFCGPARGPQCRE